MNKGIYSGFGTPKTNLVSTFGANNATYSTNVLLTATSKKIQRLNMTITGLYVTLPSATSLSTGIELFVFSASNKDYSVRDSNGNLVCSVSSTQAVSIYLLSNDTNNGVWCTAIQTKMSSTPVLQPMAALGGGANSAVATIDDSKVLYVYQGTSNYLSAVIATIDGSTISFGTVLAANALAINNVSVAMLSSTKAICTYRTTGTTFINAIVFDISGTTISNGSPIAITSADGVTTSVTALTSTSAICVYIGASSYPYMMVLSISGNTVSNNTAVSMGLSSITTNVKIKAHSSTLAVAFCISAAGAYLFIISISGTTPATLTSNGINGGATSGQCDLTLFNDTPQGKGAVVFKLTSDNTPYCHYFTYTSSGYSSGNGTAQISATATVNSVAMNIQALEGTNNSAIVTYGAFSSNYLNAYIISNPSGTILIGTGAVYTTNLIQYNSLNIATIGKYGLSYRIIHPSYNPSTGNGLSVLDVPVGV